jgi:hypothetical protein
MNQHSDVLDAVVVHAETAMIAGLNVSRSTMTNASR